MTEDIRTVAARLEVSVREIFYDEEEKILALPRAQKRTASFKKAVFVSEESVYKGPYGEGETKLFYNLIHTSLVMLLERWLGVVPTVLPFRELLRTRRGEYYLVSPNVGDPSALDWEVVSTKIETDIKVLKRRSFLSRVSEAEEDSQSLPEQVWVATLQHLYVIYLLGIGDYGSHNILLTRDKTIVGIDLEELRGERAPQDKLDALFKKVSAKNRQVYRSYVRSIEVFREGLPEWQQDQLKDAGLSEERLWQLQENIEAFLQLE